MFGFNGQISIGHSTFAGISAFFLGYSVRFWDNKPFVSLLEACVLCFVIGLLDRATGIALEGPVPCLGHVGNRLCVADRGREVHRSKGHARHRRIPLTKFRVNPPTWTGLKTTREDRALYLFWVALVLMVLATSSCATCARVGPAGRWSPCATTKLPRP